MDMLLIITVLLLLLLLFGSGGYWLAVATTGKPLGDAGDRVSAKNRKF